MSRPITLSGHAVLKVTTECRVSGFFAGTLENNKIPAISRTHTHLHTHTHTQSHRQTPRPSGVLEGLMRGDFAVLQCACQIRRACRRHTSERERQSLPSLPSTPLPSLSLKSPAAADDDTRRGCLVAHHEDTHTLTRACACAEVHRLRRGFFGLFNRGISVVACSFKGNELNFSSRWFSPPLPS